MSELQDHPQRYALANELHARPFPSLAAPAHAVYLAVKRPEDAAGRDRDADLAHLLDLLDRFGAQHPKPGATHYFADLGPFRLKWEQHTEFVTYTAIVDGVEGRPFDKAAFSVFPDDWLAQAPGARITSGFLRFEPFTTAEEVVAKLSDWFVGDSLAASEILDGAAVMAGDFRIDSAGHMRFAVFPRPDTGPARCGRILQRICEIETYKTMSMLGFARARELSPRLGELDNRLNALMKETTAQSAPAEHTLGGLLQITAELEQLLSQSAFRFSATDAYSTLVLDRIRVLREERFENRQTFHEFMARRFDPAMRTVRSAEARLRSMAERAARAGELLRTRVDVERSAQNQKLLESMDRRADLQLRLQETVEGLSVVAISYYAVSLAAYLLYPAASVAGVSKGWLTALLVPVVVGLVFVLVRRVRKRLK
ncbi:DUF3422 domain-containing protein [Psychromarinibacter sp. C21-152]|uniref:DUF3422 domain-containing protein n=1 Tax=Psychromarinibacter sediminicola TaxID=3033385 RepID=A0AAE3NVL2_9RHOB|nr:DUF3422 domain-containing protein [Psychromarinibacter sediminicola]MDF0602921.1 DUF3422 domain-containing protein [Psychromarinibacter sediminicola]